MAEVPLTSGGEDFPGLPKSAHSADCGPQIGSEAVPSPERHTKPLDVMTRASQIYLPCASWVFYFSVFNTLPDASFSHAEESSFIEFGFMLRWTGQSISIQNGLLLTIASQRELEYPK